MKRHSFEEVMQLDQALQFLAGYEVTGGNMITPESSEELVEMSKKIANKFNYFKDLIRSGECTLDYLKHNVLDRNGPFAQSKVQDMNDPNQITKWIEEEKLILEEEGKAQESLQKMVGSLLSGILPKVTQTESKTQPELPPTKSRKRKSKKSDIS